MRLMSPESRGKPTICVFCGQLPFEYSMNRLSDISLQADSAVNRDADTE